MNKKIQHLIMTIEKQFFAIPVDNICEVIRAVKITKVPDAESMIKGVIDLSGEMIPVLDIREKLKLSHKEHGINERIIIFSWNQFKVAFIIDEVIDVIGIRQDDIKTQTAIIQGAESPLLGISKYKDQNVLHYSPSFFTNKTCSELGQQNLQLDDMEL